MGMVNENKDKLFAQMPLIESVKSQLSMRAGGDRVIWLLVLLLASVSVLVVYSATGSLAYKMNKGNNEAYLFKQLIFFIIGFVCIYFAHLANYQMYSKFANAFFIFSILALVYTLFFGAKINEGSRWIKLPILNFTLQTSDIARLALFIFISKILSKRQEEIKDFKKGFLPLFWAVVIICGLIAPANLSTALLTGATALVVMFIGRVAAKHLALVVGTGAFFIIILLCLAAIMHESKQKDTSSSAITEKLVSYGRVGTWIKRVQDFVFEKEDESLSAHSQIQQAKIAIANGGLLVGLGPGNSRQRNFLPHSYSDFIYAIIIEEYGLLGGLIIILVYLGFLFRCIRIFKKCPYAFGAFLALALSFTLVIQAVANMAVNVNLVPVTGVTLPLVSMGGSSFLFTCISIGIILSVSRSVEALEGKDTPLPTAVAVPVVANNAEA